MTPGQCGCGKVRGGQWLIPSSSLMPESVQQPKKTLWLSLQRWVSLFVDEDEIVATMAAAMSTRWRRQECGGQFKESGWGEEENNDTGTRQWQ
jgi:hypothetical protein